MKLSKLQKSIVNNHLQSKETGIWTSQPLDGTLECIKTELLAGRTIRALYETIETRFCSVGSQIMAAPELLGHLSNDYKRNIRRGFAQVFTKLNIH